MKNLKLSLILITIAIFSNFAFAGEPLKWKGDELSDAFQGGNNYGGAAATFSNNSSLIERGVCQPGYPYQCPGTNVCCEIECGALCYDLVTCCGKGLLCCGNGYCCPTLSSCCGFKCCEAGQFCSYDGECKEYFESTSTPTLLTSTPTSTSTSISILSAPTPQGTISCTLKSEDIKTSNYRKTAENANPGTFAYEYDSNKGTIIQKTLKDINDNLSDYEADHVFEAQIITNYLKNLSEDVQQKLCCSINSNLKDLKDIINDASNLRFLSEEINLSKGILFSSENVKDPKRKSAAIDYLVTIDIYHAFTITRKSVIDFLREVAEEATTDNVCNAYSDSVTRRSGIILLRRETINATDIETSFSEFSRSAYEDLTNKKLPTDDDSSNGLYSNASSSTFQLPYLPVILSTILILVILVFDLVRY